MSPPSVPAGGPANLYGIEYQLLWSLFHATQWKVVIGSDHGITAILEPESGIDFEYFFGQERRVEQIAGYGAHSWFGHMCKGQPFVLRTHATTKLEEKRKKLREELAKRERS